MSQAQRRVPLTELRERVPTASASDRHYTNAERRLPPRLHQSVRRVVLRPPSTAASFPSTAAQGASFSGFPNQCGESSPDRQALRRVPLTELRERVPTTSPNCPTNAASYSPKVTQFAELRSEQKQLTALTIGNEGIQLQWHSRAHTRKHEAALPPVLMFFL